MNADQFEGKWDHIKGSVREHWGRLTDDDVEALKGKRQNLIGNIQEKYGDTKQSPERTLAQFEERF